MCGVYMCFLVSRTRTPTLRLLSLSLSLSTFSSFDPKLPSMKDYEEKYKNVFWLRPAFRKQFFTVKQPEWSLPSLKIIRAASATIALIFFFFFLLFIGIIVFARLIDLSIYSGNSSQKPFLFFSRKTNIPDSIIPLSCHAWNQTQKCPQTYPTTHKPSSNPNPPSTETCPDYFRWIHEDLRYWKETGITRDMVDRANRSAHFRLVIKDGKAYVERFRKSLQTRDLFTLWGFVQLLRWYPGRLPDLELMFDCDDRPAIQAKRYRGPNSGPPPLFKYCSDGWSMDIVFPDWSFWGWAETNIKPWHIVLKDIKEGNKRTKWEDRVPYAYWRGNPNVAPTRGNLMSCNVTNKNDWKTHLFIQDWHKESKVGYKESNLEDQCTYRYKIYIEGWAWSVSEKYILACDSPTLYVTPRFYNFFIRGMMPLKHFWPIRDYRKCKSLKFAVEWGNNNTEKAKSIGEASSRFIQEDLKMEYVYDYMFHLLNEYAKLLRFKPIIPVSAMELCSESMACLADGNWNKFMVQSLVRTPTDTTPCAMPPPYGPMELGGYFDEKFKAIRQVEAWENEYWNDRNKKH